jgi:ribose 5-phosphate isomerase RpiB
VELAQAFLGAQFRDEGRFRRRLDMILAIEAEETAG